MAPPPLLTIGLGNPGKEYEGTRHNAGYLVVDALADRLESSFEHRCESLVGWATHDDADVGLALPVTYMNRTGDAVAGLREYYDLEIDQLLVVVDDIHLSVGDIRLRPGGSSGGHNGLSHIAQRLGTTEFPRLRIGIGSDFPEGGQVDYVLSPFTPEQKPGIQRAIETACDAVLTVATEGLEPAMNQYN